MRRLLKTIYIFITHPRLVFSIGERGKNFIIRGSVDINHARYLSVKDDVRIGFYSRINFYPRGDKKPKLLIGARTYIGNHFTALCADSITIESDVLIASYVMITDENHGMDPESTLQYGKQPLVTNKVLIKTGAWIGEKVSILPGVTIGKKSIVATGSVVTKSIPDFCIAAGVPAKVLKTYDFKKKKWINNKEERE